MNVVYETNTKLKSFWYNPKEPTFSIQAAKSILRLLSIIKHCVTLTVAQSDESQIERKGINIKLVENGRFLL